MNYISPSSFRNARVQSFGSGGGYLRSADALTVDQIASVAPSVFADGKHDSRSERYTYIPTSAVLDGLAKEGFHPYSVKQGGSRDAEKRGFTKHMIRLRHEGAAMLKNVGDCVPEVVLINSHDGTSSYHLTYGFFRLVCSNGLIVADPSRGAVGVKVPHKGDIVGNVIEGVYSVIAEGDAHAQRIENMQAINLAPQEQEAFVNAALPLRFDAENLPAITAQQVLQPRRTADVGNDLWRVFNRTQEALAQGGLRYVQRDAQGRMQARRTTRPVNGVEGDLKLNRQLWALAESMAQLKAVA